VENQVEEIKQKLDIATVVGSYISLTKSSKHYKASCPFHSEKTPSFMVSPEIGMFKCFGCGKSGDIFTFVEEFEKVDFREALEILAEKAGVKLSKYTEDKEKSKKEIILEANLLALEFYHFLLTKHEIGKVAREYLNKRGVSQKTIETFSLGYSPRSWDSLGKYLLKKGFLITDLALAGLVSPKKYGGGFFDMFRGRLMFPLKNSRGQVVGFSGRTLFEEDPKYINTKETPVFKKESFLFGLNVSKEAIKKEGMAVVVEGEFDMITPFQHGLLNIVGAKGTALTRNQIGLLKNLCDSITLIFDSDFAGREASLRGIEVSESQGVNVKVAILPEGSKDPDDAVSKNSKEFFKSIKEASSIYDFFIKEAEKRFNLQDPVGKKKAGDFVIPVISKITNPIEKEHYLKKLATVLGTSQNAISATMEKYKKLEILGKKEEPKEQPQEVGGKPYDLESYLFVLVLKLPKTILENIKEVVSSKLFLNPDLKKVYLDIENKPSAFPIDVGGIIKKLPDDLSKSISGIYLNTSWEEIPEDGLLKVIQNTIYQLKLRNVKLKIAEISGKIKKAEEENLFQEVDNLSKEFNLLSSELSRLEKS